ncbi:methyl-accepting chemotaxis protein [Melaminivora jejuensis]|uniref:methyl-accepting chemotaxis protein n=1 Tax=Melaminivora jejuensis TaxID=1267217 RepID=UPI001AE0D46D|nr:methyl-accepting chemotaxis protein [Melaminivora jejuensis]UHJ65555.1 methyl-accepting chemotaxis protein [Melaminivora jejuensis]
MNFSHMKVGTRLGLGFALVILAGLAVALIGGLKLQAIQANTALLVQDRMVKIEQINDIMNNLNVVARASRNIAMMDDPQQQQQEKLRIDEARARNSELYNKLQATVNTDAGRQLLEKLSQQRASYNATIDKAVDLGLVGQSAMTIDVLLRENRPLQAAYLATLQELTDLQKKAAQDTAREVQSMAQSTTALMALVAGLAAVVGAVIAWLITRTLVRQLGGEPDYAASVAREIAGGNLAVEVRLPAGDSTSLLATMLAMRDSLAQVVTRVRQGSEAVASASTQIAQGNQDLSGRTESQASALEQTAASMEELGSTVRQNADNARTANQLAQSASTVAVQGGEVVDQVVQTMRGINDASRRIADIIGVIDSIAFQTNILALNAAVEAARAGEQGRGFAVVAGEVRQLAQRSAEAAKEIKQLITDSVERVEQGTQLVDRAGSTMDEVVTGIRRVTDIMGEISAASGEQSQGVLQVGEAVQQMDQATQQNAALVEEMAAAASSLNQQAQELVQTVGVFRVAGSMGGASAASRRAVAPMAARPAPVRTGPAAVAQRPAAVPGAAGSKAPVASKAPTLAAPKAPARVPAAAPAADNDEWESF